MAADHDEPGVIRLRLRQDLAVNVRRLRNERLDRDVLLRVQAQRTPGGTPSNTSRSTSLSEIVGSVPLASEGTTSTAGQLAKT